MSSRNRFSFSVPFPLPPSAYPEGIKEILKKAENDGFNVVGIPVDEGNSYTFCESKETIQDFAYNAYKMGHQEGHFFFFQLARHFWAGKSVAYVISTFGDRIGATQHSLMKRAHEESSNSNRAVVRQLAKENREKEINRKLGKELGQ